MIKLSVGLWLLSSAVFAADTSSAITVSASDLRAQPDAKASVIVNVPAQTTVNVGERSGAWYKVTFNKQTGWMRMLSLRLQGNKAAVQNSGLADLAAASRGTKSSVGTGIRGLTAQQLEKAEENHLELAKLEKFAVDANEAQQFARSGGVVATRASSDKE